MDVFMFAGSARKDSINRKLLEFCRRLLVEKKINVDFATLQDFEVPLYNQDNEVNQGIPRSVEQYIRRMEKADCHIIASPEYNYSIPGTVKNLIDWVSRKRPMPWKDKKILLMSASPSLIGGNRGLWQLRIPLEGCGAYVFPQMFSLCSAYEQFDGEENLIDSEQKKHLQQTLSDFISFVEKIS